MKEKEKLFTELTFESNENENEEKLFAAPRWTEYQNVKPLNIHIPPTEKDKENGEKFIKFIEEQIKKEEQNNK